MSLTMSQGDGLTVITITTNPESKWPLLCQILGELCYSPVCSVSQKLKGKLTETQTALGIAQIIVGVINIVLGILFASVNSYSVVMDCQAPFWLGCMFLFIGFVCILAAKYPSSCLLVMAVILNVVGAGLAIAGVVLYSVDVALGSWQWCDNYYYYSSYNNETPSPEQMRNAEICQYYKHLNQMVLGGLDIMMIVLSVLQLCITISFCVLTLKALCKKSEDVKSVEDPQLREPLLDDATAVPAC